MVTRHGKEEIKKNVLDKERREEALQGLSALEKDIDKANEDVSKDLAAFEKLIRDYQAKPGDFDALAESALAKRRQEIEKLWDDRSAMLKAHPSRRVECDRQGRKGGGSEGRSQREEGISEVEPSCAGRSARRGRHPEEE